MLDILFNYVLLGQLVVTTFLFYSGYGIICSINKTGMEYIDNMPKKRILKTLILLDIPVLFYAILNVVLSIDFSAEQFFMSLIGWDSLGNSSWYIFAILSMYIITYISFQLGAFLGLKKIHSMIIVNVLVITYLLITSILKGDQRQYYNTILCYPLGMWYGFYKTQIDSFIRQGRNYRHIFIITFFIFVVNYTLFGLSVIGFIKEEISNYHQLMYLSFVLCIVLISMKVRVNSRVLKWFGENLLSVFILQRLPMIYFSNYEWAQSNHYIYFVLCLCITILLSLLYKKVITVVSNLLQ